MMRNHCWYVEPGLQEVRLEYHGLLVRVAIVGYLSPESWSVWLLRGTQDSQMIIWGDVEQSERSSVGAVFATAMAATRRWYESNVERLAGGPKDSEDGKEDRK